MSRVIKFRVWDKPAKSLIDNAYLRVRDGRVYRYEYDSWEKAWTTCEHRQEDFEVEQFTGLFDKNGKEIYEGDVVTLWLSNYPVGSGRFEVTFKRGSFGLKTVEHGGISKVVIYGDWKSLCNFNGSVIEVLGNVHENRELLT